MPSVFSTHGRRNLSGIKTHYDFPKKKRNLNRKWTTAHFASFHSEYKHWDRNKNAIFSFSLPGLTIASGLKHTIKRRKCPFTAFVPVVKVGEFAFYAHGFPKRNAILGVEKSKVLDYPLRERGGRPGGNRCVIHFEWENRGCCDI